MKSPVEVMPDVLFECLLLFVREYWKFRELDPADAPRTAEDYIELAFDAQMDLPESEPRATPLYTLLTRSIARQIDLDLGPPLLEPPNEFLRGIGH